MNNNLIVFEGLDCCGKSSVIKAITPMLINCNYTIFNSYEPSNPYGEIAKFGRFNGTKLNNEETIYFWWLARQYEQNRKEFIDADIVLKDRHYDTTWVYLNFENTSKQSHNFDPLFFQKPLLTIYLDVTPEIAIERMKINRTDAPEDAFETSNYKKLEKRRNKYFKLIEEHKKWRSFSIIDTVKCDLDQVIGLCFTLILRRFENHSEFSANQSF